MVSIQRKSIRGRVRKENLFYVLVVLGALVVFISCCGILQCFSSPPIISSPASLSSSSSSSSSSSIMEDQSQRLLLGDLNNYNLVQERGSQGGRGIGGLFNNIRRRVGGRRQGQRFADKDEEDNKQQHQHHQESQPSPSLLIRPVQRIDATKISFDDFQSNFASMDVATQPIVLENVFLDTFDESQWTREFIAQECGDISLYERDDSDCQGEDCHSVQFVNPQLLGKKWAGLQKANLKELGISTLRELLELQDQPKGHHLYLHDASVSHYCPPALERLQVPRYFSFNADTLEWDYNLVGKIEFNQGYPRMFVSKKGAGSPLHIDGGFTRFWIHQLSGHKLWRLFPPSEYWRFGPDWRDDSDFQLDAMNPDFDKYPLLDGALAYETILAPGEVIFVPENWAHQVVNLDDAISHGVNYIDWNFMPSYLKHRRSKSIKDLTYVEDQQIQLFTAFFMPLDPRPNKEENLNFHDYFEYHHLALMKQVPAAVKKFVKGRSSEQIDEYRDIGGRPAIVVATFFHFTAVVEYLLEEVKGINVNEPDMDDCTALDYAVEAKGLGLSQLLAKHGGVRHCVFDEQ